MNDKYDLSGGGGDRLLPHRGDGVWRGARRIGGGSLRRLTVALDAGSALVILGVMLMMAAEIVARSLGGRSLPGTVGIVELMLAVLVSLAFPLAYREGKHVTTGLVADRLPPRVRIWVETVGVAMTFAFMVWFSYAAIGRAISATIAGEMRYGVVEIVAWPGRIALAVGLSVMALEVLRHLIRNIELIALRLDEPALKTALDSSFEGEGGTSGA